MTDAGSERDALLTRFDRATAVVRTLVERTTDPEFVATMPSGWAAQEMLGHLAFWLECTKPVVNGMLRGDVASMAGWRLGSGYVADETKPWPVDTVHNQREAEWARHESREAVLARLDAAIELARSVIESLTDDEAADPKFIDYVTGSIEHVEEHSSELS